MALPKLSIPELKHYRLELPEMVNSQFLLGFPNPQTRSSMRQKRVSKHFTSILVTDSCWCLNEVHPAPLTHNLKALVDPRLKPVHPPAEILRRLRPAEQRSTARRRRKRGYSGGGNNLGPPAGTSWEEKPKRGQLPRFQSPPYPAA